MAEGTEPIRQDIDAIRDSMTQKMEQIESKVKGTVDTTVEQVKRTFDLKQQVSERPWAAIGVAFAAGYMLGTLGDSDSDQLYLPTVSMADFTAEPAGAQAKGNDQVTPPAAQPISSYRSDSPRQQNTFLAGIFDQFSGELHMISNAAIAAGVGMLRDSIKDTIPQFSQEYERARQQTPTK